MSFVVNDILSTRAPPQSLLHKLIVARGPIKVQSRVEEELYHALRYGGSARIEVKGSHNEVSVLGAFKRKNYSDECQKCCEIFYIEDFDKDFETSVYEVLLLKGHGPYQEVDQNDKRRQKKYRHLILREYVAMGQEHCQGWPNKFTGYTHA